MNQEKIAERLEAAGVPPARAEQKAADSAIGWTLILIGVASGIAGSAAALMLIAKGAEVGLWIVLLVTLFLAIAFTFVGFGMHLLARDGAPKAVRAISDALVRVIRAVRGERDAG